MLRELHIQNLAVIEDATIEFAPGLNVFTGETGAGKSLVIGAFEVLLGLRPAKHMLRAGAEQARVAGVFDHLDDDTRQQTAALLDCDLPPGEELLITRKLFASGRSTVSVNGHPVTAGMLKTVGRLLVDIHGQHDHQYLLRPLNQLHTLDAFARADDQRQAFAQRHAELRALRDERDTLAASATLRRQQLDLYRFQADEIDAAAPQPGELPELHARHKLLGSLQKIEADATGVYAALYDADGSVNERLQAAVHVLTDLAEIDPDALAPIADQVRSATLNLQEASYELSRYLNHLEQDPAELAEIEDRLNTLNRLVSKYGDGAPNADAAAPVLAYRQQIAGEIARLETQDADLTGIDQRIAASEAELQTLGTKLTLARRKAADAIVAPIEAELQELGMAEAKLRVQLDAVPLNDAGPHGLDAVELLVQTNPGQGFRPLREIASGGELSRVMLALKSVLAGGDRVSVLVFDEIDANIGGRLGSIIGRKLRGLTSNGQHQVLCITHLPQIAAFGDRHLHIRKSVTGNGKAKQTATSVSELTGKHRVDELAAMMAGQEATATTRKQAKELLAAAGPA